MQRHVNEIHSKAREFECQMCDKDFCRSYQLDNHVATVHYKLKTFKCDKIDDCTYKCVTKSGLIRHIEEVHENKKPHKCPICAKSFSRKNSRYNNQGRS